MSQDLFSSRTLFERNFELARQSGQIEAIHRNSNMKYANYQTDAFNNRRITLLFSSRLLSRFRYMHNDMLYYYGANMIAFGRDAISI